jgi:UDP-N-acetylmuramoylalanine--D-glutamate ligase
MPVQGRRFYYMTLNMYLDSIKHKKIAVVGIGISNTPLIELLVQHGCDVTACDKRSYEVLGTVAEHLSKLGVKLKLGEDYLHDLACDICFRTPGIHPQNPELQAALSPDTVLTSEMEVFFALCPCKTIAITGSDGKTTTSSIIAELLKADGYRVHLGGNIGKPLLTEIPDMQPSDVAVLELSSFQLHSMYCKPDVAVITNISPNHLDVHPDYQDYIEAKRSIYKNQDSTCRLVLNRDNNITAAFASDAKAEVLLFSRRESVQNGVFLRDGMLYAAQDYAVSPILPQTEIRLPGIHNVENYMAAFCAVRDLVSREACQKVASTYGGVRHRLEMIRVHKGVTYCNDSIASSPTRTIAGLRSFKEKPILIAGGYDKNIPFEGLGDEICRRVKALYLTGNTAEKIKTAVQRSVEYDPNLLPIYQFDTFKEAVLAASAAAKEGDLVLLSPACASFDQFKNFAERGDTFRDIVNELE